MDHTRIDSIEALRAEIAELKQGMEQLYQLNEMARLIAGAKDLEGINQTIVRHSIQMIGAEQGVVSLINTQQQNTMHTLVRTRLTKKDDHAFRPDMLVLGWMSRHRKPLLINDPTDTSQINVSWHPSIRSFLCVPLIAKTHLIGLLCLYNKHGGFTKDDEKLLYIIAMQTAQILENQRLLEERNRVKQVFGQHVSPAIVDEILKAGTEFSSKRLPMCVLFMDIRGFSTFAEKRRPEEVMSYLNSVFDFMIECVLEHRGLIHRLMGDSFVALFGAPISRGNDAKHAVDAGLDILKRLRVRCESGHLPPTRVGIGIHAGEVVAGMVGSAHRKEYQINGDVVNLAARIEQLNKSFDSQMLISETVWKRINQKAYEAESLGEVEVKGRERRVRVYKMA